MKYSEVKKCLKKDDTTIGVKVYRKAGIILTWIVINCLPFLSANMITASMQFLELFYIMRLLQRVYLS